eukprot:SAG22_NODE_17302_length_307_cov_0.990385_1_plen_26_part_10
MSWMGSDKHERVWQVGFAGIQNFCCQ